MKEIHYEERRLNVPKDATLSVPDYQGMDVPTKNDRQSKGYIPFAHLWVGDLMQQDCPGMCIPLLRKDSLQTVANFLIKHGVEDPEAWMAEHMQASLTLLASQELGKS